MSAQTILLVHNFYQEPGGEDEVFRAESDLLESRGHHVVRYTAHNDQLRQMGALKSAQATLWNGAVYRELRRLIREVRPSVMHVHNTFPLVSPAAYYAAHAEKVPVVQTLHNYRLMCPSARFFRSGRVCEDCVHVPLPLPGVVHACYRGSRLASGVVAGMLSLHRVMGTWRREIDTYVALTENARQIFIRAGLPADRIVVKPNFVAHDPGLGAHKGNYALFVGRLVEEKGIRTLIQGWERLANDTPIKLVGDGPLRDEVAAAAGRIAGFDWLGRVPSHEVIRLMQEARVLVFPSIWYEGGLPMVIVEAYATGLPTIASDLGNMAHIVHHGRTGLHFKPGDPQALVAAVRSFWSDANKGSWMSEQARREYEDNYTPEQNYGILMRIYARARARVA
jgi:glycosyltransferase involved in cell wall biosynthesis